MTFHSSIAEELKDQYRFDVIIAGAGPVGLFLACELALANCSVLVLEKAESLQSPLKRLPFGIRGLNSLSIEALDRRGLFDLLDVPKRLKDPHANAEQGARRQVGHFAGIPLLAGNIDSAEWPYRLPSSTDTSAIVEMEELETVLARRAEELGAEILRGHAITGFEETAEGVSVVCGEKHFAGRWLVGCDGARSAVRKLAGIESEGTEPEFTGYSAHVDLVDSEKLKPGRNITAAGMYLQSQPGYLMIQDFDGGAFHGSDKPITLEHVQAVLRCISGTDVTLSALHAATTWTDRARQAVSYRKGRVLLAGDSAHIHAPLGGQGLNLGIGDAMNLGWKLAAEIRGDAPVGLLDSYQAERHPLGVRVLEWSRAQAAVMKPEPGARALLAIVRDLIGTRDGATYVAERLWGITTRYDLNGEHPLVGCSAPNFEFDDGTTLGGLMRGGTGIMLDFAGHKPLAEISSEYAGLKYIQVRAKKQLGLNALLVRPDGFVAWAADGEPEAQAARKAAAKWFPVRFAQEAA